MSKPWKTLSTKVTYERKWLRVREDACELPDGRVLEPYIILEVPSFCNVVIVTPQEEVVMVKQFRHAVGIQSLELPGGMIDPGESAMDAAHREMQEETGYSSQEMELLYEVHPNPPLERNRASFFLARNAVPNLETSPDPYEDIELVLVPRAAFMEMLLGNQFTHGVQAGGMYAAAVRLGWLVVPS